MFLMWNELFLKIFVASFLLFPICENCISFAIAVIGQQPGMKDDKSADSRFELQTKSFITRDIHISQIKEELIKLSMNKQKTGSIVTCLTEFLAHLSI